MLTFRNINIFFTVLLLALLSCQIRFGVSIYMYALWLVAYLLIIFYGCYNIRSNFFLKVTCSADTDRKDIAISFDDGPVINYTAGILKILTEHGIRAAFFCIGNRIAGNEHILQQIRDEGHIIGNHSYTHDFWFDMYSSKKMLNDLKEMDRATEAATGLRPLLFRPPYGVTNPNVRRAVTRGGYSAIGWNVRSMDTVIKNEEKLLEKVLSGLKPGAVFLFHDTSETTYNILPRFIKEVKKQGYNIIPLDKLLNLRPYA